jgi:hypothetical protein
MGVTSRLHVTWDRTVPVLGPGPPMARCWIRPARLPQRRPSCPAGACRRSARTAGRRPAAVGDERPHFPAGLGPGVPRAGLRPVPSGAGHDGGDALSGYAVQVRDDLGRVVVRGRWLRGTAGRPAPAWGLRGPGTGRVCRQAARQPGGKATRPAPPTPTTTAAAEGLASAETGSSATISLGRGARVQAMPMRCRWPPENSCG